MTRSKHFLLSLLFIPLLVFGISTAGAEDFSGSLQIKGSDTMINLAQAWAEEFMKEHPESAIAVTGGGSGTGIASLINGTCDLAIASRDIKKKEIGFLRKRGLEPQEHILALDGIAVVVHPDNPVGELTIAQLRGIFKGAITDWADVGGNAGPIVLLSRAVNSGTHVFFAERVLTQEGDKRRGRFSPRALLLPSSQAIAGEVAQNPNAIGYYGMGYASAAQKVVAVGGENTGPFALPTAEAIRDTSYPLARPLFVYSLRERPVLVDLFLDFARSPRGQELVIETDFVPATDG